mmetsp:Transcript_10376/g.29970  ORF Transcript_10376/g.29970 Transcript_10376/m.29970 type:complete len:164 (-) Transcript_10376:1309-1800(-)
MRNPSTVEAIQCYDASHLPTAVRVFPCRILTGITYPPPCYEDPVAWMRVPSSMGQATHTHMHTRQCDVWGGPMCVCCGVGGCECVWSTVCVGGPLRPSVRPLSPPAKLHTYAAPPDCLNGKHHTTPHHTTYTKMDGDLQSFISVSLAPRTCIHSWQCHPSIVR